MRTLIRFILKFKTLFLFIILEILSLVMIVNHNRFQRVHFLSSCNILVGSIYETLNNITDYFSLGTVNDALAEENAELKNKLVQLQSELDAYRYDSTYNHRKLDADSLHYTFQTAKVVHATTNLTQNHLTIDKGEKDGIYKGMGVINEKGIVGIVSNVSNHFALVMPIINTESRINAKVSGKSDIGTIFWNGGNIHEVQLEEVPHYIQIEIGDTIRTSAYSSIFPEGLMIGTIISKESKKDNFYSIDVELSVDYNTLSYVDVIQFNRNQEREELEEKEAEKDNE